MDIEMVYNEQTFYPSLYGDMRRAKALVILQSPFISIQRIDKMKTELINCAKRGVRVCVFVREPDDWSMGESDPKVKAFIATVELLESMGAHVTVRPLIHEKYVVVDDNILYAGSLNILSQYKSSEEMRRWEDPFRVRSVIRTKSLDRCAACCADGINMFPTEGDIQDQMIQAIREARMKRGFSQADLSAFSGVDQRTISLIECGKRNFSVATFSKLCRVLDVTLHFAPWYATPAVTHYIDACKSGPDDIPSKS